MTISRGQMNRQLYMGGGIMNAVPREEAFIGGVFKAAKKATKKVVKGVKDIASSDIGKAALIGAAAFGIPGTSMGGLLGRASFGGAAPGIFGLGGVSNLFSGASTIGNLGNLAKGKNALSLGKSASGFGNIAKFAGLAGVSGFLTSTLGMSEEQAEEELTRDPSKYLELYYRNLNPPTADTNSEQYEQEVRDFVSTNTSEYKADGGRIGGRMQYAMGSNDEVDLQEMLNAEPKLDTSKMPRSPKFDSPLAIPDDVLKKLIEYLRRNKADGGIMNRAGYALGGGDTASQNAMQAAGIEGLPMRQNPKGVQELDLRDNGGFIPPVGIKEKEDDIPAMLSNNEFVFTADAVRGMGDGDVELGAQRMYDQMKTLEEGGRV